MLVVVELAVAAPSSEADAAGVSAAHWYTYSLRLSDALDWARRDSEKVVLKSPLRSERAHPQYFDVLCPSKCTGFGSEIIKLLIKTNY